MQRITSPRHGRKTVFGIICTADVLLLFVLLAVAAVCTANNRAEKENQTTVSVITAPQMTARPTSAAAEIETFYENDSEKEPCLVYDRTEDKIIYQNRMNERLSPASLAKLLTALVASENVSGDKVFEVGDELDLVRPNSSLCLISKGNRLTLDDLLYGMLLPSGNDAAYTVAVNTAKILRPDITSDEEAVNVFAEYMNAYAQSIGMKNSHFVSPEGWDDEMQYSTVYDLLLLTRKALSDKTVSDIVKTESRYVVFESGENVTWYNTNEMLRTDSQYYDPHCKGVKTGSSSGAGYCLISEFVNDGDFIIIVTGCDTDDRRYELTEILAEKYCK